MNSIDICEGVLDVVPGRHRGRQSIAENGAAVGSDIRAALAALIDYRVMGRRVWWYTGTISNSAGWRW
jgi:hypothetical protein